MMPDFTGITTYIYAAVAALLLGLGITVFVQHTTIKEKTAEINTVTTKLQVSNQSVDDLTKALTDVKNQLVTAEQAEAKKQAEIDAALKQITQQDKSLENLETSLKNRKSTSNCPVPKDLNDAWNSL